MSAPPVERVAATATVPALRASQALPAPQPPAPATASGPWQVALSGDTDLAGFRIAARALLAAGAGPDAAVWQVARGPDEVAEAPDLFGGQPLAPGELARALGATAPVPLRVPRWMGELVDRAGLHAAPDRFARLWRLLWRLQHEPRLRGDRLDPERVALEGLARQVRREEHKAHAFVRFRPIDEPVPEDPSLRQTLNVAWFEPEHHIVEAVAPFFVRRFASMRWALLTPRRSVRWDGRSLQFGPGARRADAPPADAGEALWLAYYRATFNPARLNLAMTCREMPVRYWANLPEAALIPGLARGAAERQGRMLGH
jgi:DNA polymerase